MAGKTRNALSAIIASCALMASAASAPAIAQATSTNALAEFSAHDPESGVKIDYAIWTELLRDIVLDVGMPDRLSPPQRVQTGTRVSRGNTGRYQYEGNRVLYHIIDDGRLNALSEYRRELEEIPSIIPMDEWSKDEQLAYWLNLYNVTVIEQIALRYPTKNIDLMRAVGTRDNLFDAKILNVQGVSLSLNDIQYGIVYPNWDDPVVMYGFFSGAIGGPSLARTAYTSHRVKNQLAGRAREYTSSLRGIEAWGDPVRISQIYFDSQDTYFPNWPEDVRMHILDYTDAPEDAVETLINNDAATAGRIRPIRYDWSIADLVNGNQGCGVAGMTNISSNVTERPGSVSVDPNGCSSALPPHAAQLVGYVVERRLQRLRAGEIGQVIVSDIEDQEVEIERVTDGEGEE